MRVQSSARRTFRATRTGLLALGHVGEVVAWLVTDGRVGIDRVTAIVNGASNFVLTRLAAPDSTFESALQEAQHAGFAGADASWDVDGHDACDKLTLLASLFDWSTFSHDDVEVQTIRAITREDLAAAREIGGAIKPVVWAARGLSVIEAFVGPSVLSSREPLAAINGALTGIRLDGKDVSDLFFSGPSAGPPSGALGPCRIAHKPHPAAGKACPDRYAANGSVIAPASRWFVRLTFPGVVPADDAVRRLLTAAGLEVEHIVAGSIGPSRWLTTGSLSREAVDRVRARLRATHRIESYAIRNVIRTEN